MSTLSKSALCEFRHAAANGWFSALRPLVHCAANDGGEPSPAIVILCCGRSQREKCGMSERVRAATQRFNRPFVDVAA
jgi:hypothetical protein